jgi:hypothetical protein
MAASFLARPPSSRLPQPQAVLCWRVLDVTRVVCRCRARLLSGRAQLPPQSEQEASVAQHYQWMQEVGRPLRYCHMMDSVREQSAMKHCFGGGGLLHVDNFAHRSGIAYQDKSQWPQTVVDHRRELHWQRVLPPNCWHFSRPDLHPVLPDASRRCLGLILVLTKLDCSYGSIITLCLNNPAGPHVECQLALM